MTFAGHPCDRKGQRKPATREEPDMLGAMVRGTRTVLERPELAFGLLALAVIGVVTTVIRESATGDQDRPNPHV